MSKLEIGADEARGIIWGEGPEGIELIQDELVDTSRWSEIHEVVIKRDGKFYKDQYSVGATEMQDESPWEYSEPEFVEVVPVEKTVIVYEVKK